MLGNAVFTVFQSSQCWETRFFTFSQFPKLGKGRFHRFPPFPMLGQTDDIILWILILHEGADI